MNRFLHRLGTATAAHPWRTIAARVAVAAATFALAGALGGSFHDDYDVQGARAQAGIEQLRDHLPGGGGATAQVVLHDPQGDRLPTDTVGALRQRLAGIDHVVQVGAPRFSEDFDTALVTMTYDVPTTDPDLVGASGYDPLVAAVAPDREAGLQAELGGELPSQTESQMSGRGELAGVVAALVLLVVAFGSIVAAGLPLVVTMLGLAVGSSGVALLARLTDVSTAAPTVATMVGLGVGIDYALLLVTRYAELLDQGADRTEAAGRTMATSGRAVVFASLTVLISLMGLRLGGLPVYDSFGYATAITVVGVLVAALTLVPALCGLAGPRLLSRSVRRGGVRRRTGARLGRQTGSAPGATRPSPTARWARRVVRRPVVASLGALLLLLLLAAPVLGMRTWPQDGSSADPATSSRRAYDLVSAELGAGANGPITVVVDTARADAATVADVLAAEPGVVRVTPPVTTPDGALSVLEVEPSYGPTDERTAELVTTLRTVLPAGVELTGLTPFFADISSMLSGRVWVVVTFVVGVSVLLLAMMFRSVVVPVKAAVMNLLSIGASYGVLTAAFQWGWGGSLLGVDHPVAVSSWIPILNFAILFGLSMDYEVFLLSRIREDWLRTGDPRGSVERGLASTGRVISSAAAIMVVVFLGFSTEADTVVKQLGFGMAVAIVLDATLVRLVLVPATMTLLGRWNWWLPGWLDRRLPTLHVEAAVPVLSSGTETPDAVLWAELDADTAAGAR